MKNIRTIWKNLLTVCLLASGCTESYTPKPRGYFRIEPPTATYRPLNIAALPCTFEVSSSAEMDTLSANTGWLTLHYPELRASLYCNYLPVRGEKLAETLQESRRLVWQQSHIERLREQEYSSPVQGIYGMFYLLEGDCISPIQFMLTDSTAHFFRAALYYDFTPKADSIRPVTEYLRKDMMHLVETFS